MMSGYSLPDVILTDFHKYLYSGWTWLETEQKCVNHGGHLISFMRRIEHGEKFVVTRLLSNSDPLQSTIIVYIGLNDIELVSAC